jgi:hypothetical protein
MSIITDSKIKIGGQNWIIQDVDEVDALGDKGGLCNFDKNIIFLRHNRNEDAIAETLIHEILHILFYQSGIDRNILGNIKDEELIVSSLANGILQVFRDNLFIVLKYLHGLPVKRKSSLKKKRK